MFCEKLSVIALVDDFVLHICWRWVEKKINFMNFNPPPNQNEVKCSHNRC